jgi:hypothetical protein
VVSDVSLGALQVGIGYAGIDDEFRGSGDQVDCRSLNNALSSFNDDEATRVVTAGFVSLRGSVGTAPSR